MPINRGAILESLNNRYISTFTSLGEQRDNQEVNLTIEGLDETRSELPAKQTIGVGIGEPKKWYIGGHWTETDDSIDNSFYAVGSVRYEDPTSQLSIGGFYIPEYDSFSSYWKRIVYRIGFISCKKQE